VFASSKQVFIHLFAPSGSKTSFVMPQLVNGRSPTENELV
jgi:hypothetical protein